MSLNRIWPSNLFPPPRKTHLCDALGHVRGYDYCDGGLSNQKLALLGLILSTNEGCSRKERGLFLPHMCVKDQQNKSMVLAAFGDAFDEIKFRKFLNRWDILVHEEPAAAVAVIPDDEKMEKRGWNYFYKAAGHLGDLHSDLPQARNGIAADFFRSLTPKIIECSEFKLVGKSLRRQKINIAAQLRIELDWSLFSQYSLTPTVGVGEDFYIPAEQIVAKIKKSIPDGSSAIFVSCDEKFIFSPRADITNKVFAETGCVIVWKSDILGDAKVDAMSPLDTALFDFETCLRAEIFVGNSRSTFANLASFERFVRSKGVVPFDYIYNLSGESLGLRSDHGTQIDPYAACQIERPIAGR